MKHRALDIRGAANSLLIYSTICRSTTTVFLLKFSPTFRSLKKACYQSNKTKIWLHLDHFYDVGANSTRVLQAKRILRALLPTCLFHLPSGLLVFEESERGYCPKSSLVQCRTSFFRTTPHPPPNSPSPPHPPASVCHACSPCTHFTPAT